MAFPILAISAIVPSLLITWFFHSRDFFPEPPRVLWATFGLGVLTVVPVLLFAAPVDALFVDQIADPIAKGSAAAFLTAALPEELFKLVVVARYCGRHREFDEPMDGIVYGVVASLGFATLENVLYVSSHGFGVAVLRAFTAVPGHAFMGALMGHYVARAKFGPPEHKARNLWFAFAIPFLLHGLYDMPLLSMKANTEEVGAEALLLLIVPVVLVVEGVWAVRLSLALGREQVAMARLRGLTPSTAPPAFDAAAGAYRRPMATPIQTFVQQPATPTHAPTSSGAASSVAAWLLVLGGGLFATVGGLLTLGVIVGAAFGGVTESEATGLLIGTAIVGTTPLGLGALMFRSGLGRLNRVEAALA